MYCRLVARASFCQHWPVRLQGYETENILLGGHRDHCRRASLPVGKGIERLRGNNNYHDIRTYISSAEEIILSHRRRRISTCKQCKQYHYSEESKVFFVRYYSGLFLPKLLSRALTKLLSNRALDYNYAYPRLIYLSFRTTLLTRTSTWARNRRRQCTCPQ